MSEDDTRFKLVSSVCCCMELSTYFSSFLFFFLFPVGCIYFSSSINECSMLIISIFQDGERTVRSSIAHRIVGASAGFGVVPAVAKAIAADIPSSDKAC